MDKKMGIGMAKTFLNGIGAGPGIMAGLDLLGEIEWDKPKRRNLPGTPQAQIEFEGVDKDGDKYLVVLFCLEHKLPEELKKFLGRGEGA